MAGRGGPRPPNFVHLPNHLNYHWRDRSKRKESRKKVTDKVAVLFCESVVVGGGGGSGSSLATEVVTVTVVAAAYWRWRMCFCGDGVVGEVAAATVLLLEVAAEVDSRRRRSCR